MRLFRPPRIRLRRHVLPTALVAVLVTAPVIATPASATPPTEPAPIGGYSVRVWSAHPELPGVRIGTVPVRQASDVPEGIRHYVALGDSFSAGPFIPPPDRTMLGCARSLSNYPHLLNAHIKPTTFVDVSCSAAKTADMTESRFLPTLRKVPPQLDALRPETDLVTLTIGGNDLG
jgi:hypothetical protein